MGQSSISLLVFNRVRKLRVRSPIVLVKSSGENQAISTDYDQRYADWMTAAFNRDDENFATCLSFDLYPQQIDWSHLDAPDSYAISPFWVRSSSVYSVTIESVGSGRILIDGLAPKNKPEITNKLDGLTLCEHGSLKRQ